MPAGNSSKIAIICAKAVWLGPGEIVPDGAVAFNHATGRIENVGPRATLLHRHAGAIIHEHPDCALLPGFINAHTHLELGYRRSAESPGPQEFPAWVDALMAGYPRPQDLEAVISGAVEQGARECISFGVTAVGDICRHHEIVRRRLARTPLNGISYGEITALGRARDNLVPRLAAAANSDVSSKNISLGLSPHAPYSVEAACLGAIVAHAAKHKLALTMHLAELSAEWDFLRDLSGPLGRSWSVMRKLDLLDDAMVPFEGGPIRWAKACGLLDAPVPVLLAHVNYAEDAELDLLAGSRASVVLCPRTRQYFGHDGIASHRWPDMLARGINVCLGTDSLASNPDLSVLAEAGFLMKQNSTLDPELLLTMITSRAAQALGLQHTRGQLRAGGHADIIALPVGGPTSARSMAESIVMNAPKPDQVWINAAAQL